MTPRHLLLLAALVLLATGAVVACTLQPQPLPPSPAGLPDEGTDDDKSSGNGGSFETPPPDAHDAGPIPTPEDGGTDASDDGGDAGDGG